MPAADRDEDAPAPAREAASVILLREDADSGEGAKVLLASRRARASFMAGAWVFPGGAASPEDAGPRATAARELREETGIDLASGGPPEAAAGALCYFAHWITPSIERKRFSARFYVAKAPPGQAAQTGGELVDAVWLTPAAALARTRELSLPPPQIAILRDLDALAARGGADAIFAACAEREARARPILPRVCREGDRPVLLLPWDPDYETRGRGEGLPIPADHPVAVGPSRFTLEDRTWKLTSPPASRPPA